MRSLVQMARIQTHGVEDEKNIDDGFAWREAKPPRACVRASLAALWARANVFVVNREAPKRERVPALESHRAFWLMRLLLSSLAGGAWVRRSAWARIARV